MDANFSTVSNLTAFYTFLGRPKGATFTCLHVNIRSLRKYWDYFSLIVRDLMFHVDAFIFTETNIPESMLSQYTIKDYNNFFSVRPTRSGGGIVAYVHQIWQVSTLDLVFCHAESLTLKLDYSNLSLSLLCFYRPPSENSRLFLSELELTLSTLSSMQHLCLVGDFNIDTLKTNNTIVCDYLNILSTSGLECVIAAPTREELLGTKLVSSCIDHICIRAPSSRVDSAVIHEKLADHYFVGCRVTHNSASTLEPKISKQIKIIDIVSLDKSIASYDWDGFLGSSNSDNIYPRFVQVFNSLTEAAKRTVILKKRRLQHKWLSFSILEKIKEKDILWSRCRKSPKNINLRNEFRQTRNKVNAIIRCAKRQYFKSKFEEAKHSSSKTWSLINQFRSTGTTHSIDQTIEKNFGSLSSSLAEDFNNFFATYSGVSRNKDDHSGTLHDTSLTSAFLPTIEDADLHSLLFGFKNNKSPGVDGIRTYDLQRNFTKIKNVLLVMLNGFITCGTIPTGLKVAMVRPLFKGGIRSKVENYRPISILPIIGQLLEKHLFQSMSSFIEKHGIFTSTQYGFIPGRGTQPALDDFSDYLYAAFEKNMFACALFLDVSKAFDTVSHQLLLKKLQNLGFRGPFFSLLESFLSDRAQSVVIGDFKSSLISLKAGVPQGSILSPLLFNIFVNDMAHVINECKIYQYADDTLLVARHIDFSNSLNLLQANSTHLMDWFTDNLLDINSSKTKLVCFRNPLKKQQDNVQFFLHPSSCSPCNCVSIESVDHVKYLGVYFDYDMSWNTHMSYLCGKLRSIACMLFNTRVFLPVGVRLLIVHALAYSILRYGVTVFGNCSGRWQEKINILLKGILKSIAYNTDLSTSADIFDSLKLPNFRSLFIQTVALRYFWNSDFKTPVIPSRTLRRSSRFEVKLCSTRYGKCMREYYVPFLFNALPDSIYHVTSLKTLKQELKCLNLDTS